MIIRGAIASLTVDMAHINVRQYRNFNFRLLFFTRLRHKKPCVRDSASRNGLHPAMAAPVASATGGVAMRAVREGWPANTARPIEFNVGRECYRRAWLPLAGSLLLVPLLACGRAAPQGQESSERKAPVRNIEPTSAQPSPQPPSQPLVAISGQKHDAPACPSTSFSEFLKSYVNRLDLQNAFTLRPIKVKSPYYWKHNTEPGDPRYPKWITQDSKVIMPNIRYRYDASSQRYVWDDKDLKLGEVWSAQAVDGSKRRVSPLPYFKVRRLSAARYDVDYIRSGTDSFVMKSGCWHLEEQWEREAIVDCKWPDECRRLRESESEAAED